MGISFEHHEKLEINRITYSGQVTAADLDAHANYRDRNPEWLCYDHLNIVAADADPRDLTSETLAKLFSTYKALFDTHNLLIMRRSAWLCHSEPARKLIRFWLNDIQRRGKDHAHTDVRPFESVEAAAQWLMINDTDASALVRGEGFTEVARFGAP